VPDDGLRRHSLNSLARKPLVAGGKDVPDEPRRAPVLQRARQLGQLTGDDRQDVGLQVTALVEEGADRPDVGLGVEMTRGHIVEALPKVLGFIAHFDARGRRSFGGVSSRISSRAFFRSR
jgi:hypothetical protein